MQSPIASTPHSWSLLPPTGYIYIISRNALFHSDTDLSAQLAAIVEARPDTDSSAGKSVSKKQAKMERMAKNKEKRTK